MAFEANAAAFDDAFDDSSNAAPIPPAFDPAAPTDLLSAAKVAMVRFSSSKPGYTYAQVETFVGMVSATLTYLESRMSADHQEIDTLSDQVQRLKATIEIFRAKGDPVATSDGGYATESSVAGVTAERDELRREVQSLKDRLTRAVEAQRAAEAEMQAALAGEAELRAYIDTQLLPWLQGQEGASAPSVAVVAESPTVPSPNLESVDVAQTWETWVKRAEEAEQDPTEAARLRILASSPEAEALGVENPPAYKDELENPPHGNTLTTAPEAQ